MISVDEKVLIIDCQTTSMHPKTGHIVQLGWCVYERSKPSKIEVRTLQLPNQARIPKKICELLQINNDLLNQGHSPVLVMEELQEVINELGERKYLLAHYMPFELSFLKSYFSLYLNQSDLDFTPLCTQKITKKLFPHFSSYSLKALGGYLKFDLFQPNSVASHVELTLKIWELIKQKLIEKKLSDFNSLHQWLNHKEAPKQFSYCYNIDRLSRLELPNKPGVYRMFSHENKLLYIGKASSLKNRVNSYFRGIKNRNKRTLEMLAQVWRIETVVCESVLEAELQEAYEIRTLKPAYNVILNQSPLCLIFYQKNFDGYSTLKTEKFCEGPFRINNLINDLIQMHQGFIKNESLLFHNEVIDASSLQAAWLFFSKKQNIAFEILINGKIRLLLAIGYGFLRDFEQKHGKYTFEKWWKAEKKNKVNNGSDVQQLAERIYRLFLRAASCRRDGLQLINLMEKNIVVHSNKEEKRLIEFLLEKFPTRKIESYPSFCVYYDQLIILLNAKRNNRLGLFCLRRDIAQ